MPSPSVPLAVILPPTVVCLDRGTKGARGKGLGSLWETGISVCECPPRRDLGPASPTLCPHPLAAGSPRSPRRPNHHSHFAASSANFPPALAINPPFSANHPLSQQLRPPRFVTASYGRRIPSSTASPGSLATVRKSIVIVSSGQLEPAC
ncbi:MAG: hypothetical protein BJ554DRAFT_8095 [Olpidium bornovanus]|uniref:Uncharacterized protein n=1 Tax=Olpidium bornovanus TaxID=278681 RepID=A0A8H7ZV95_9FUNG|nr:MAG: hypothetical protein BJ554DRAFT_8095 [Olpidium bornovanus]